ncbi:uncharacterized protein LOC112555444 [Pomacea canaliculata]|uniref:uncharacterized protein LOC112555444 n=1 Tax=Pomacea canaliculata TaxID=400727 RepID=UPI000D735515|nr:uncharacterized protein LOC112555444 [Pomacea canaliculata]
MLCGEVHVATPGGDGGRSRLSAPDGVGRYGGCACGSRCRISCCRCRRSCGPMTAPAVVVVVLVLLVVVGPQECVGSKDQSHKRESDRLDSLLKAVYHERWREFPEYATYSGYHGYDDALESFTMAAFDRRKELVEKWLAETKSIPTDRLSKKDQREVRILKSFLQTYLDGYKWRDYGSLNSVNFLEGVSKGPQWPLYSNLKDKDSLQNYLKRLAAVPSQVEEQITLMKRAMRLKRTNHIVSVDRVPSMIDRIHVEQMYAMPFQSSLEKSSLPRHLKTHLWEKAKELIDPISKSLKRLKKFVEQEYLPVTRSVEGVHSLASGAEYYQACLDWYLGFRITPEEIFDLGVREVSRIENNIKKIMENVGFRGNLKSFFQYVKFIPKFYNHTKEELLLRYNLMLDDVIQPKLSRMFYNVPIPEVLVAPIENDGPWGSYGQNVFYVNLKEPNKRSTFTMLPLALHETNPGHHFQESYTRRFSIPGYRADAMNGRLFSVPFHFPVYSAYAEGWALYAEYLGEEMGLFDDHFDLFGRYCSEIFRACRLVVDSGIHAFGWDRDRAISFLSNYSDFPASQIEAEVDRYITWPGQACAYKVGEIKIKEMRQRAEEQLGRRFDPKEFHHEILKVGYVPLDILDEVITEWIESKKDPPQIEEPADDTLVTQQSTSRATTSSHLAWLLLLLPSAQPGSTGSDDIHSHSQQVPLSSKTVVVFVEISSLCRWR